MNVFVNQSLSPLVTQSVSHSVTNGIFVCPISFNTTFIELSLKKKENVSTLILIMVDGFSVSQSVTQSGKGEPLIILLLLT